jgi:hypothetical protein
MKKDYTHIIILIDRSGSMNGIQKDMEGGLTEFIKKQTDLPGTCTITAAQFDSHYEKLHSLKNAAEVGEIKINPRGNTALIDSMCKLIIDSGKELSSLKEEDRPEKVLFLTITDGEENSSHEYTNKQLKEMIKLQEEVYKWEFAYIGANQDSFSVASDLGISNSSTKSFNYTATSAGIGAMLTNLSTSTATYRSSTTGPFSFTNNTTNQ